MMLYLQIFFEFFKTGLFAVGGGMATIPFLYELSDKTGWFTHEELANMVAVGESTPGPIGVNMATYVGFLTGSGEFGTWGGVLGAVIATLGLITPSIIIILIVASVLNAFRKSKVVTDLFYGLRPASTGMIAAAGLGVIYTNFFVNDESAASFSVNWLCIALAVTIWVMSNVVKPTKKLHPIVFIAFAAVVGIVFKMG